MSIGTVSSGYNSANAIYAGKTAKYLPTKEYGRMLSEKMNETQEKIENGSTEPSFVIGAKAYTEREWDTLLENLDATLEDFIKQMRAEHKQRFEKQLEKEALLEEAMKKELLKSELDAAKTEYTTYESANYKIVPDNDMEYFCIYNANGEKMGTFAYSDIKIKIDTTTKTKLLISEHGTAAYSSIVLNEELIYGLEQAMHIETLEEETLEGYTLYRHGVTGIRYLIKDGDEGRGGNILISNEQEQAAFDKLAQTYLNDYPNLVSGNEVAESNATLEILGLLERTENGILTINRDGMSYNDNTDTKNNWALLFHGEYYEELYEYLKVQKISGGDFSNISLWEEFFKEKEMVIERIWSDEELEQGYLNN